MAGADSQGLLLDSLTVLPYTVQVHSTQCYEQIRRIVAELFPDRDDSSTCSASSAATSSSSFSSSSSGVDCASHSLLPAASAADHWNIQPLTGGLSNSLFVVTLPQLPQQVLVRVHPAVNPDIDILNRQQETLLLHWLGSKHDDGEQNHQLQRHDKTGDHYKSATDGSTITHEYTPHQQSTCDAAVMNVDECIKTSFAPSSNYVQSCKGDEMLCPAIWGCFQNGRVEEFYPFHFPLPSCRHLTHHEEALGRFMGRLHQLQPPIPLEDCWTRGTRWLHLAENWIHRRNSMNDNPSSAMDEKNRDDVIALWRTCQQEWDWIQQVMNRHHHQRRGSDEESAVVNFCAQTVLNHGDGQSLNVLVSSSMHDDTADDQRKNHKQDNDDLRLIDYEYASFSPRGCDIANTFLEHCDMNNCRANYAEEYPSMEHQATFLGAYLHAVSSSSNQGSLVVPPRSMNFSLDQLMREIGRYTVISHMQWTIWSLVQHFQSEQEFDYIRYAKHRLEGYYFHRQLFWRDYLENHDVVDAADDNGDDAKHCPAVQT